MKFTNEFLDEVDTLQETIADMGRWTHHVEIIFKNEDKFYRGYIERGNTENQEGAAEDDPEGEQECPEVHQVEKLVKVWEPIEGENKND